MDAQRIQQVAAGMTGSAHDIAAQINALGLVRVVDMNGGVGTIMRALGPAAGAALLDQLESAATTVPAVRWAFVLINRGDLNFGDAGTRAMIDQLVTDPAARAALKAVAEVPDTTNYLEVGAALGV